MKGCMIPAPSCNKLLTPTAISRREKRHQKKTKKKKTKKKDISEESTRLHEHREAGIQNGVFIRNTFNLDCNYFGF